MRRALLLTAVITAVTWRSAIAGPGSASGPITVDSTSYVAGSSVMGTDGGVYSDTLPPVASTTTAAFRMTKYRAQHVNLRDNSGTEIGTVDNPLYTTASSTITISNVTVNNSSFSVTGSTIVAMQTDATKLNATVVQSTPGNLRVSASISGSSNTVSATQSGTWNVNNTSVNVATVTISGTPSVSVSNTPTLGTGTNNIGTVSGSSVTIPGNVNTRQVNVSTVIVQSMPAVTVSLSTVTITNTSFTIVGITSVTVMNPTLTVQLTGAVPAGANQIGHVSGSTVTVYGNVNATVMGTPNVNVLAMPNVAQTTASALKASVFISGSSNTVQSAQSGSWTSTVTQGTNANLRASVAIDGSSNTVQAAQSGAWTATATQGTASNLKASVSINGSSNTVAATQSGSWTNTATQTSPANLQTSASINGSSNTVTATQPTAANLQASVSINGSSNTVTSVQGTPANLQTSASINGSSNTVTAIQGTPVNLQASVSISGSSNTVQSAQSGSWTNTVTQTTADNLKASVLIDGTSNQIYVTNVTTSPIQVQNGAGTLVGVGWQTGGSSIPVHEIGTSSVAITNTPTVTLGTGTNNVGTVSGSSVTIFASNGTNFPVLDTQSGTRWSVAFSTTSTTAVLSSTGVTTSVAISTPIAGLSSQTVRVYRLMLSVDTATNITFRDGSTNFGDTQYLTANGGIVLDLTNEPWYITSSSNGFVIKQSGSANIGVRIWYTQS